MDEDFKYNIFKHKQTNGCWSTINIVLTLAYFVEFFKGLRDLEYIVIFTVVCWAPWIIFNICRCLLKFHDITLEYIAGIGYLFFYIFAMTTSNTDMVFCYIFPMLTILTVYSNKILNTIVMSLAIAINLGTCITRMSFDMGTDQMLVTNIEIQIACVVLCTVFLWRSSKVLTLRDNMIETLANDAYYDVVTKIHNRMYLSRISSRHKYEGKYVHSLAIIDIDKFKDINDKFGHQAGDDALIKVAELMTSVTKTLNYTTPIRLGGDEFIILSEEVSADELYIACAKLRRKLSNNTIKAQDGRVIPLTVSIGIIDGFEGADFTDLYEPCDKLLYEAKEGGRNAIVIHKN